MCLVRLKSTPEVVETALQDIDGKEFAKILQIAPWISLTESYNMLKEQGYPIQMMLDDFGRQPCFQGESLFMSFKDCVLEVLPS